MRSKQDTNIPAMERELNYLLYDLCVHWGVCIPPVSAEEISQRASFSDEEFAEAVLIAEGMNPEYEKQWMRRISKKFTERFGVKEIDKQSFIDRARGGKESWG